MPAPIWPPRGAVPAARRGRVVGSRGRCGQRGQPGGGQRRLGSDDILLPGTGPAEIDARLRLLVGRRAGAVNVENASKVVLGELVIDEGTYTARLRGRPLDLTYKEFELLKYLAQHAGRVFTRAQLLQEVWGYDFFGGTRTVDVHVRRLRAKLGGEYESLIGTVRNVGYKAVRLPRAKGEPGPSAADDDDESDIDDLDDDGTDQDIASEPGAINAGESPTSVGGMTEWVPLLDNRRQLQIRELIVEATRADGIAPVGEQVLRELRGTGAKHLVAEDGDDVAAFLNLVVPDEAASENATAMAELVVAPAARRRGIGSAMVREALAEGGAGTRVWAHGDLPAAQSLATKLGLVALRRLHQMRRALADLPAIRVDASVTVRHYLGPQDDSDLLRVNNAAFSWHPEQGGWTPGIWPTGLPNPGSTRGDCSWRMTCRPPSCSGSIGPKGIWTSRAWVRCTSWEWTPPHRAEGWGTY